MHLKIFEKKKKTQIKKESCNYLESTGNSELMVTISNLMK